MLRQNKSALQPAGKNIILADDGVATGATVIVAIEYLRQKKAAQIILALPVAAKDTAGQLRKKVDQCLILQTPPFFQAVGQFYQDFSQVTDEQVAEILNKSQL